MKQRLDLVLVERRLAASRSAAQAMIMAGEVKSGTTALTKPGQEVDADIELIIAERPRYVSRGGDKLASVVAVLRLDFQNKVVLDVGSSTGGFTDYALQHGAIQVFAVDVGSGQLAYQLRQDERVVAMERTDIRDVTPEQLDPRPDMAVIDASFISLTKILPTVAALIKPSGQIIAMAKPQFEADKPTADRYKGVIKNEVVRGEILDKLEAAMKEQFQIAASADSKVSGAQGNRERFYVLKTIEGSGVE
jgi:23S rRNA (cytidine1920-2'-O)/16S rRNA (cytidine1409-2'-O)-methyltransferase